ncbi:hypothetical protein IFM89_022447 [Coptis chinensis]|uniref:MTHFR SAM-binding regulatory domain-containing protein n=1 Tax=Coptis chinensis TaxID=261450 RepID=A0A835I751_9MAGN|nr:hypothetical protein IFM89_022447 [Coptis chinensis]
MVKNRKKATKALGPVKRVCLLQYPICLLVKAESQLSHERRVSSSVFMVIPNIGFSPSITAPSNFFSLNNSMRKYFLIWFLMHKIFMQWCLGKLESNPWSELNGLQAETKIVNEQLGSINLKGFLTINNHPSVNAAKSDSPSVGE